MNYILWNNKNWSTPVDQCWPTTDILLWGHKKCEKISKNRFFKKCLNFHNMIRVVSGPAWGSCFGSIMVWGSPMNSLRKSKKIGQKMSFLWGPPPTRQKTHFLTFFFDFRSEFISEPQTIIETKQDPLAGPETTTIMFWKFKHFFKIGFLKKKFNIFYDPPIGIPLSTRWKISKQWSPFRRTSRKNNCLKIHTNNINLVLVDPIINSFFDLFFVDFRSEFIRTPNHYIAWNNPNHVVKVQFFFLIDFFNFFHIFYPHIKVCHWLVNTGQQVLTNFCCFIKYSSSVFYRTFSHVLI